MDLSIVERLICPEPHAAMPLIVRADEVVHGRLISGVLGCPHCHTDWSVTDGVARFGARATLASVDAGDVTTIAALLGLSEPMLVLVDGASPQVVGALTAEYSAVVIALDPGGDMASATVIDGAPRVPIAGGTVGAALMLRPERTAEFVASAARALAQSARMVAAATLPLSGELVELARDETRWVATREQRSTPVALRRRGV